MPPAGMLFSYLQIPMIILVPMISAFIFGPGILSIGVPLVVIGLIIYKGVATPRSSLIVPTTWHGDRTGNSVNLSFDDGPDPDRTPRILEILREHGAHATFFVIGRHAIKHPELIRKMLEDGHEVANHSMDHPRTLNFAFHGRMLDQVSRGAETVMEMTDVEHEPLYRPPVGLRNPTLWRILRQRGCQIVTWSISSRDRHINDEQRYIERIIKRVQPGDIVMMHDGSDGPLSGPEITVRALPGLLQRLTGMGLECVTCSQLLGIRSADH
ncbi:MAG: hypothetical protein CMJ32_05790 [Phycisphaerae bacterium]|nr:hypothetical protein [Phycisphaerae bacterium]